MATSKSYLQYVMDQAGCLDLRYRAMMGEYVLYYRDKVIGGLYDNCLMVKDVPAARALMPEVLPRAPYEGARGMLEVERLEDREFLEELFEAMYPQVNLPKPRRRRKNVQ